MVDILPWDPSDFLAKLIARGARTSQKYNPLMPRTPFNLAQRSQLYAQDSGGRNSSSQRRIKTVQRNEPGQVYGSNEQSRLGELYEMLLEQMSQPVNVDQASLMAQARGQIDPIYDQRIAALEDMMARAEERSQRQRQDIEQGYELLAEDYEKLAPEQAEQAEQTQASIEELYGTLASNIEGHYSRISDEQMDLFKQLGIEDAAPEVLGDQQEQQLQALQAAEELGALNQQRYIDIGDIDETYWREGSPLAILTGQNVSTDMMAQLQDYLAQQEAGIQGLESERAAGIQGLFSQLLNQAQNRAASTESTNQQMLFDMLTSQMGAGAGQELTPEVYLRQLDPQTKNEVSKAFRAIERSEPIQTGQVPGRVGGTSVSTPDTYWIEAAEEMYNSGQLSAEGYLALTTYLRLAFGLPGVGLY